jgi:hypothetical protein
VVVVIPCLLVVKKNQKPCVTTHTRTKEAIIATYPDKLISTKASETHGGVGASTMPRFANYWTQEVMPVRNLTNINMFFRMVLLFLGQKWPE